MAQTVAELFHDYKLICQMQAPIYLKARILSELLGAAPDPWSVVGITLDALMVFKRFDFKRHSRMGINRAHLSDRYSWLTEMLENQFDIQECWWALYLEKDKTVLATASENRTRNIAELEYFLVPPDLFRNQGYAWKHGSKEIDFLKSLYKTKV